MTISRSIDNFLQRNINNNSFELLPCAGGKNNQCYQVKQAEKSYFLKCFFTDSSGLFPKLDAEYRFLQSLQLQGNQQVAKPLAVDFNNGYLLTEFIV